MKLGDNHQWFKQTKEVYRQSRVANDSLVVSLAKAVKAFFGGYKVNTLHPEKLHRHLPLSSERLDGQTLGQREAVSDNSVAESCQILNAAVKRHRNPEPRFEEGKDWGDYALNGKLKGLEKSEDVINQAREMLFDDQSLELADLPENKKTFLESKVKEIATKKVYAEHFSGNVERGMYNPSAINREMEQLLGVTDSIPGGVGWDNILKAIDEEVGCFTRKGVKNLSDKSGRVVEQKVTITNEQRWMLMKDVQETFELYKGCYQNRIPPETAFKALRHMARTAIYQTYFDKGMLTGSDHGVLHAHHNCGHSDGMHDAMDEGDMPKFGRLLVKFIHYYHDIGYSVGAADFSVKKDHPFIGAGYIDANRAHFEECLPLPDGDGSLPERFGVVNPVEIISNVILNHANISFDSDPDDLQKLIMFTVTNSDACAVSQDEKSQAVWRENPELLIELMRLQKFIEIHPKYSGFSRLGADEMPSEPEKVLKLKAEVMEKLPNPGLPEYRAEVKSAMALADSYRDPDDYLAFKTYEQVRGRMFQILADKSVILTQSETAQFQQAIANSLTGVGSGIVVGQYAVKIDSVKCSREHDDHHAHKPKYQPHITLKASREAKLTEQVLGEEKAVKNTRKLCEEYKGQADEVRNALKAVVESDQDQEVRTPVAKLTIAPVKRTEEKAFEARLREVSEAFLPAEIRSLQQEMHQLFKHSVKNKFLETDVQKLQEHISKLQAVVENSRDSTWVWRDEDTLNKTLNEFQNALLSDDPKRRDVLESLLSVLNSTFTTQAEHRFVFEGDLIAL